MWEFPGGKVDPGESPESALVRELREELAVEVAVGLPLSPVVWNYGEKTIRLRPFLCTIIAGESAGAGARASALGPPGGFRPTPVGGRRYADSEGNRGIAAVMKRPI